MSFVSESSRLFWLVNFKSKLRAEGHEVTKALFFQIFFKVSALLQARSWAKAFQAICTLDGNINFLTEDLQSDHHKRLELLIHLVDISGMDI